MALVSGSRKDEYESVNGCSCDMAADSSSLRAFCRFSATWLPCLPVRIPWRSIVLFRERDGGRCLDRLLWSCILFVWRGICGRGFAGRSRLRARSGIDRLGSAGADLALRETPVGESRPVAQRKSIHARLMSRLDKL